MNDNFVLKIIKVGLKNRTGFETIIDSIFEFNVEEKKLKIECTGEKNGKPDSMEALTDEDENTTALRSMLLAKAGNVRGEIIFFSVKINWEKEESECIIYFRDDSGQNLYKKFKL